MTPQEWIVEAERRIENNNDCIEEVQDMVGSDYSRHRSRMESALSENRFIRYGIEFVKFVVTTS